ncbi:phage tail tape measure protein, partial [Halalkalicoccus sp. NIPERK01]|uniref:phage tail tape measure protein n=1 Tax=Halalkalicoccus sp. NIPERK01 TaxID=3053469 RepID=UPI00256F11A8
AYRFGNVLVALGNNFATTESEITEFTLRMAASGRQAGLTTADVAAYGAALSSVGVEAEAGGTAMSKVFTDVADAVRSGQGSL